MRTGLVASRTFRACARRAFTLIELLVVIAVIAVLAALLMPALEAARARAYIVECASNMRQINLSLNFYSDDWQGLIPGVGLPHNCTIPVSARSCEDLNINVGSGLGVLYGLGYMRTSRVCFCKPETNWGQANVWWGSSAAEDQHLKEWRDVGGRWNSSYMYRWACPNPYADVWPGFPNQQSVPGRDWAARTLRTPGNGDRGVLIDQIMSWGLSPATATGTAHPGGGNALYFNGRVAFLSTINNPYNPAAGRSATTAASAYSWMGWTASSGAATAEIRGA